VAGSGISYFVSADRGFENVILWVLVIVFWGKVTYQLEGKFSKLVVEAMPYPLGGKIVTLG